MKYLKKFNENINSNYKVVPIIPLERTVSRNSLNWYINNKRCGVFSFIIKDNDQVHIVGYMKDNKSVDGYEFIKLSIDYLLNNGIKSIISYGNRSEDAAKVWRRLNNEVEYSIRTIDRHSDGYIPDRHSTKILTKSEK